MGKTVAETIYRYARLKKHLKPSNLLEELDKLDKALKQLFGSGARVLVDYCALRLSWKLNKAIQPNSDSLSDLFRQITETLDPSRELP